MKYLVIPICAAIVSLSSAGQSADYDPLRISTRNKIKIVDFDIQDSKRERVIPIRVYLPNSNEPAAVVLFSHGLGGSRNGNKYLGDHWAGRGYVVVFPQHHGSDDAVWKDAKPLQRFGALKKAASLTNTLDRYKDIPAVLDQLNRWNRDAGHALFRRIDISKVGMSGHSYGAITTQGVSGQSAGRLGARYTDKRIDAALAMSPSPPRLGDPKQAFGSVTIPWMLMTGTKDTSPITTTTVDQRMSVYSHLPDSINRYQLVLHDAHHSAFSDAQLRTRREQRNPNHHRAILALSTAFWDAHLLGDSEAQEWLQGAGARGALEAKDGWQMHAPQK